MGWKQAVLSAGVSSSVSKKRNIEKLKNLTIEERRKLILQTARSANRHVIRKTALGTSRTNLLSIRKQEDKNHEDDVEYIPTNVDKKRSTGTLVIPTQTHSGTYEPTAVIAGYTQCFGQTGSVPNSSSLPSHGDRGKLILSAPETSATINISPTSQQKFQADSKKPEQEVSLHSPPDPMLASLPNGYTDTSNSPFSSSPVSTNTPKPFVTTEGYIDSSNDTATPDPPVHKSKPVIERVTSKISNLQNQKYQSEKSSSMTPNLTTILGKAPPPIPRRSTRLIQSKKTEKKSSLPFLTEAIDNQGSMRPKSMSFSDSTHSFHSDWSKNKPLKRFDSIKFDELASSDDDDQEIIISEEPTTDNWTDRFQTTLSNLRSFNANTPLDQLIEGNAELLYLAQDFLHCAETYGRIIIAERFLSPSDKTIKPISLGGVSGGEKYIVHHTLFKFAVDSYGILGSDYAAAKVAGNELKGLICYFNTQIAELRVPLMALVDYMGFRIIAMSLLPIDKSTLVYGTNDGGISIHNSNMKLSEHMKQAAENINIKKHICGLRSTSGRRLCGWKELYAPADLEGHLGDDGHFYLIDFARTLPPESPDVSSQSSHLYRLLRPEFIKAYNEPLCSDAFSGFVMADPDYEEHNQSVRDATNYLLNDLIPRFVRDSLVWQVREAAERDSLHEFPLTEAIHAKGICMRHIGYILKHVRTDQDFSCVRALLLAEAIARVIKNKLRGLLRRKMKHIRQPLEAPYRQLVVRFLNLVFGKSHESTEFWNTILKKQLKSKFNIKGQTTSPDFPLKKFLGLMESAELSPILLLFNRLVSLTGLKFTPQICEKLKKPERFTRLTKERYPFDDTDLDEIGYRVKHMNIIAEALGSYYYYKGLRQNLEGSTDSPVELLRTALEKYEEALGSNPTNVGLLKNAALCCTRIVELVESGGAHLEDIQFDPTAADIQKADQYYIRAVASDPDDAETLYSYAKFLWKCCRFERAEEYFLQSLETNPSFVWCLRDYGVLLSEQGLEDIAEEFFILASERTNVLSNTPRLARK